MGLCLVHQASEGVIKFSNSHSGTAAWRESETDLCRRLFAWRSVLAQLRLVGRDPARYEGAGYGNLSGRLTPYTASAGERPFIISGTQTGGLDCVSYEDFCVVERYDSHRNWVQSRGPAQPSSESMTHAAIYDLDSSLRFVFHIHSPLIWTRARQLRIPTTDPKVAYGTPDMALEVARVYRREGASDTKIMAMGGHEDGLILFGARPDDVGAITLSYLARAQELAAAETGQACIMP